MRRSALAALVGTVVVAGGTGACAPRAVEPRADFFQDVAPEGGGIPVRIEFGAAVARTGVVPEVADAVRVAYPKATRWGAFRSDVKIRIFPTHAALETELGRYHLDWLRAWATYDSVLLQSPRDWGLEGKKGFEKKRLEELLAHELSHVAVYQMVATHSTWESVDLPLWFREGLASWTADQGRMRGTPFDVGARLLADPTHDPLLAPEPLLGKHQEFVYAAAHWAFVDLLDECTADGVERILRGVAGGLSFDAAFDAVTGLDSRSFGLRWRARVEHLAGSAPPLEGTGGD